MLKKVFDGAADVRVSADALPPTTPEELARLLALTDEAPDVGDLPELPPNAGRVVRDAEGRVVPRGGHNSGEVDVEKEA